MKAPLPQPMSIHRKPPRSGEEKFAREPAQVSHHPLVGGPVVEAKLIRQKLPEAKRQRPQRFQH